MFETLTKRSPPRQHVLKLLSMDPAYPDAPREGIRRMLEKVGPAGNLDQHTFPSLRNPWEPRVSLYRVRTRAARPIRLRSSRAVRRASLILFENHTACG